MDSADSPPKKRKECTYCGESYTNQGLHSHIRQSKGDGHGAYGEVPDSFNPEEVKPVKNPPNYKMRRSNSEKATTHIYLCNWCNELCKGERGYKIHLGMIKGSPLHPDDASIEDEQYKLIPSDDDWNPLMDLEDVYRIQSRRRARGAFDPDDPDRPIERVSENIEEQIATLLSMNPEMKDEPERVMSIFSCDRETFEDGLRLA